jgi:periplasmic divalent cation tolerance protein
VEGALVLEDVMRVEAIQVMTTAAEKKDAETLAQAVLDKRLGACVQISGPIESRYWWNGRVETATEWTLTIKTRRDLYKPLEKLLLEKRVAGRAAGVSNCSA